MSRLAFLIATLTLLIAVAPARADTAFARFTIADPQGPPIEVGVWYPKAAPAHGAPLIVMSHGTGASYASHLDTAEALAGAGFVVAALTHTGDNWRDMSRAVEVWDRPRQLKLLVDYMLQTWPEHARIDPERIGAFGFSAGGFTVLAPAGGEPDFAKTLPHCQAHPEYFDCKLVAKSGVRPAPQPIAHDPRIRAVVAAAPALGYTFGREGLASVRQPVQIWRAEDDRILPHPDYAEAVRLALPQPPDYHVVPHAGHFDFLTPCSAELAARVPQICTSAPGFDRTAFHADFNREVTAFFRRTLAAALPE